MRKVIIYPQSNGLLAVITPSAGGELGILEIAHKDVPEGVPFLIVDEAEVPDDWGYHEAWEADFSNPDGYGIGHKAWFEMEAALVRLQRRDAEDQITENARTQNSRYR